MVKMSNGEESERKSPVLFAGLLFDPSCDEVTVLRSSKGERR
jgi:hypothetical protein